MKSEKGITLISLILYVIILVIVVSMLSLISNMFFSNISYVTENSKNVSEFNKFNMYFIEDVKNNKSAIVTENTVEFEDGIKYTYKQSDKGIYRNKVKICNNIEYCNFVSEIEEVSNTEKQIISIQIIIKGSKIFEATNDYVLRYW